MSALFAFPSVPQLIDAIWEWKWWIGALFVVYYFFVRARTPVGSAMRKRPDRNVDLGESWFIESLGTSSVPVHSCSFIEFDGRGDYIDFEQHESALRKIEERANEQPLVLVFYCHGWKNNSQSGDVLKFTEFLGRLASRQIVKDYKYRVHGVYLGWQGNLYSPYLERHNHAYSRTKELFGNPIVSSKWCRRFRLPFWAQENLSYWSRRNAAEHRVSGIPMARTIYSFAQLVKKIDAQKGRCMENINSSRVLVMGHSFGALMLERALYATCLDPLIDQWSWVRHSKDASTTPLANVNPLPLDWIFFVNSAAPSLYAKAMRDFLAAHQRALEDRQVGVAFSPVMTSLTSSADWATRFAHPAANVFSRFYPSLRHKYRQLIKIDGRCSVNQSWFYRRTPGHQPLLVDHWLGQVQTDDHQPATVDSLLDENLDYEATNPFEFWARNAGSKGKYKRWRITLEPAKEDNNWGHRFGRLGPSRSSYWFIRCDRNLIRDHNDIWSDTAMEVYVALYRLAEWSRMPQNPSYAFFENYWDSAEPAKESFKVTGA